MQLGATEQANGEDKKRWRTLADLAAESPFSMMDIDEMTRIVISHHFKHGAWLYEAFDYVNDRYFGGELPQPIIIPVETHAYGRAVATCEHTGLIAINRSKAVPGLEASHVILHEAIHHRLFQMYQGADHNSEAWLAECQRIAPMLEVPIDPDLLALNKPRREGKRVVRTQPEGTLAYKNAVARFPHGAYEELGTAENVYGSAWNIP